MPDDDKRAGWGQVGGAPTGVGRGRGGVPEGRSGWGNSNAPPQGGLEGSRLSVWVKGDQGPQGPPPPAFPPPPQHPQTFMPPMHMPMQAPPVMPPQARQADPGPWAPPPMRPVGAYGLGVGRAAAAVPFRLPAAPGPAPGSAFDELHQSGGGRYNPGMMMRGVDRRPSGPGPAPPAVPPQQPPQPAQPEQPPRQAQLIDGGLDGMAKAENRWQPGTLGQVHIPPQQPPPERRPIPEDDERLRRHTATGAAPTEQPRKAPAPAGVRQGFGSGLAVVRQHSGDGVGSRENTGRDIFVEQKPFSTPEVKPLTGPKYQPGDLQRTGPAPAAPRAPSPPARAPAPAASSPTPQEKAAFEELKTAGEKKWRPGMEGDQKKEVADAMERARRRKAEQDQAAADRKKELRDIAAAQAGRAVGPDRQPEAARFPAQWQPTMPVVAEPPKAPVVPAPVPDLAAGGSLLDTGRQLVAEQRASSPPPEQPAPATSSMWIEVTSAQDGKTWWQHRTTKQKRFSRPAEVPPTNGTAPLPAAAVAPAAAAAAPAASARPSRSAYVPSDLRNIVDKRRRSPSPPTARRSSSASGRPGSSTTAPAPPAARVAARGARPDVPEPKEPGQRTSRTLREEADRRRPKDVSPPKRQEAVSPPPRDEPKPKPKPKEAARDEREPKGREPKREPARQPREEAVSPPESPVEPRAPASRAIPADSPAMQPLPEIGDPKTRISITIAALMQMLEHRGKSLLTAGLVHFAQDIASLSTTGVPTDLADLVHDFVIRAHEENDMHPTDAYLAVARHLGWLGLPPGTAERHDVLIAATIIALRKPERAKFAVQALREALKITTTDKDYQRAMEQREQEQKRRLAEETEKRLERKRKFDERLSMAANDKPVTRDAPKVEVPTPAVSNPAATRSSEELKRRLQEELRKPSSPKAPAEHRALPPLAPTAPVAPPPPSAGFGLERRNAQPMTYPLSTQWKLWFQSRTTSGKFKDGLAEVELSIDSMNVLWEVMNHVPPASTLQLTSTYALFRQGPKGFIKPMWEDEANQKGAGWKFFVQDRHVDAVWKQVVLMMVGGNLSPHVNGCEISHKKGFRLGLWLDTVDADIVRSVGEKVGKAIVQALSVDTVGVPRAYYTHHQQDIAASESKGGYSEKFTIDLKQYLTPPSVKVEAAAAAAAAAAAPAKEDKELEQAEEERRKAEAEAKAAAEAVKRAEEERKADEARKAAKAEEDRRESEKAAAEKKAEEERQAAEERERVEAAEAERRQRAAEEQRKRDEALAADRAAEEAARKRKEAEERSRADAERKRKEQEKAMAEERQRAATIMVERQDKSTGFGAAYVVDSTGQLILRAVKPGTLAANAGWGNHCGRPVESVCGVKVSSPDEIKEVIKDRSILYLKFADVPPASPSPKAAGQKAASPKAASPKAASPKAASPKAAKAASPKAASPKAASPKAASPKGSKKGDDADDSDSDSSSSSDSSSGSDSSSSSSSSSSN